MSAGAFSVLYGVVIILHSRCSAIICGSFTIGMFNAEVYQLRGLPSRLHPDQRQRTASAGKVLPATRLAQATSKTTGAGAMTDSTMRTGVSTSKRNNPPAPTSTNNKKQVQPPTSGAEPPPKRQRGPKKKAAAMRYDNPP